LSDEGKHDWYGPAVACALSATGMSLEVVFVRSIQGVPWWPNVLCAGLALVLLVLMLAGWRSRRFTAVAFVAINLAMVAAFWITDDRLVTVLPHWTPFRPHQIGVLAVALLAPPGLWAGVVSQVAFLFGAVGHYYWFDAATRARLPVGTAWVTVAYGVAGVTLLVYRLRSIAAERARVRSQSEAAALEQLARSFLALRDLANTPLQTLEVGMDLLQPGADAVERRVVIERMRRALDRLRQSCRVLSSFDEHVRWDASTESFDPEELLSLSTKPRK
jgi:hypothetical protein